jgi:hypothetical protein
MRCWPELLPWLLAIACTALPSRAATPLQNPPLSPVPPRTFGLDLDPGPLTPGDGQRVLTRDDRGETVVARVHVRVGSNLIVLLPDGQLAARRPDECTPTERPFAPLHPEELLERLEQAGFANWQSHQTRRYLYLFQGDDAFVTATSRILETMFRGVVTYAQAQKIQVHPPEVPLVVILFPTREQFQAHRRTLDGVVAYYDVLSNQILMCQESPWWPERPELAIRQAIATIAHEGAHQILHNIGVQQRLSLWPMWLNEGLAEFFAPTSTDRQTRWKGAGEVNDLRMFELEQLIKSRAVESIDGQMLAQTVGAARLTSTGYATAWALTHYVAKYRREAFHAYVRQLSLRGPLEGGGDVVPPGVIPGNLRDFKHHFGEDLAEVERRLVGHLRRLPYQDPFADWPHFVAFVTLGGPPLRQAEVFHHREQADRWRQERLEQVADEFRAAARSGIREFPGRLPAEQFKHQWLLGP